MSQLSPHAKQILTGLHRLVRDVNTDAAPYSPGLEGVICGETQIASFDRRVLYRGYNVKDLADRSSFTEVALLLLCGELQPIEQLADFHATIAASDAIEPAILEWMNQIPFRVSIVDVLRTAVSMLGYYDPHHDDRDRDASIRKAQRLLAQVPAIVATRFRHTRGLPMIGTDARLSFAANVFHMLLGTLPTAEQEKALDVALILHAEQGFTSPAFTARIVGSTCADVYAAVTAATAAYCDQRSVTRVARAVEQLATIHTMDDARNWLQTVRRTRGGLPGFGADGSEVEDPRHAVLKDLCVSFARTEDDVQLESVVELIERIMREETGRLPGFEWHTGRLLHYLGFEPDLHTPVVTISQMVGWSAHAIEEGQTHQAVRPQARYTGCDERPFVLIGDRS